MEHCQTLQMIKIESIRRDRLLTFVMDTATLTIIRHARATVLAKWFLVR